MTKNKLNEKEIEVLKYCKKHIQYMWAASVAAILLECDFRDAEIKLLELKDFLNEKN